MVPGGEGALSESMVRSASRTKSKDDPHFEQFEDCSSFSVRQLGQIMGWAYSPANWPGFLNYGPPDLYLQPIVGRLTVYGWVAVSRV